MNRYQTLERRLGALVVDVLVLLLPVGLLDLGIRSLGPSTSFLVPWLFVAHFAGVAYYVLMHGWYGQTFGKMLLSVKVVSCADENPIGMRQSFLRELVTIFFSSAYFSYEVSLVFWGALPDWAAEMTTYEIVLFFLLGLWVIAEVICSLKTVKRRAIHDFIAGTVVVRTDLATEDRVI